MFKKLLLILALIGIVIITAYGALSGTYTTNSIFYRPGYGSYGLEEYNAYNAAMEVADNAIKDNQVAFGSYYLKTEIDTLGEVETIYSKDITDSDELATALTDYYLKTAIDTLGEVETIYSKDITDSTELAAALGAYYLKTEMDSFSELQAIIADKTLVNTTDKLNVFAVTSSAELAGVISDETGSGLLVYGTSPNITTPTGIVKGDIGLGNVENLKVKLDATSAPGTGNDNTEGYAVGSRWIDVTNDKEYVALDVSTGAAVWTETTGAGGGATTFIGLTDTPANYTGSSLKHVRVNVGETALEFVTLGGGGDMLKATYDTDTDGDIDVAAGGTEKSSWTQYAIPYLSNTTVFGEIPIGTAEYALTVAAGATGYDWTLFDLSLYYLKTEIDTQGEVETIWGVSLVNDGDLDLYYLKTAIDTQGEMETIWGDTLMNDLVDDPAPELGGEMDAGAHSIGFTLQTTTGDGTTTIDWRLGNKFKFTFGAQNDTFTFTAPTNPCNILLMLVQDATGSRTATWPATVKWAGGTAPTLTTTAAGIDICSFYWDGTNYFGVASLAFAVP